MSALALLEFPSVTDGVLAVDRLLKAAPVAVLRSGTVHPGRFLLLAGGSVASTEAGYRAAEAAAAPLDGVLLPDPHPDLAALLREPGGRAVPDADLLVVEHDTSPRLVRDLDATLKAVPLALAVLRLADDLGGRAFGVLTGDLADLEDAAGLLAARPVPPRTVVVARPDPELRAALSVTTLFRDAPLRSLPEGERVPEV